MAPTTRVQIPRCLASSQEWADAQPLLKRAEAALESARASAAMGKISAAFASRPLARSIDLTAGDGDRDASPLRLMVQAPCGMVVEHRLAFDAIFASKEALRDDNPMIPLARAFASVDPVELKATQQAFYAPVVGMMLKAEGVLAHAARLGRSAHADTGPGVARQLGLDALADAMEERLREPKADRTDPPPPADSAGGRWIFFDIPRALLDEGQETEAEPLLRAAAAAMHRAEQTAVCSRAARIMARHPEILALRAQMRPGGDAQGSVAALGADGSPLGEAEHPWVAAAMASLETMSPRWADGDLYYLAQQRSVARGPDAASVARQWDMAEAAALLEERELADAALAGKARGPARSI